MLFLQLFFLSAAYEKPNILFCSTQLGGNGGASDSDSDGAEKAGAQLFFLFAGAACSFPCLVGWQKVDERAKKE